MEIVPNATATLVGDTVVLRCFAYLKQDSVVHMEWNTPSQVGCSAALHSAVKVFDHCVIDSLFLSLADVVMLVFC